MEEYLNIEEASEPESEDDLNVEQLEIELYSQIHFEQNTEALLCDNLSAYSYHVEGNTHSGYKAQETTAQILLDRRLNNVTTEAKATEQNAFHDMYSTSKSSSVQNDGDAMKGINVKKESHRDSTSLDNGMFPQPETKLKKSKPSSKANSFAEKFILTVDSESDSEVVHISDDSEENMDEDADSLDEESDTSVDSSLDGLLDDSEDEDSLQLNVFRTDRWSKNMIDSPRRSIVGSTSAHSVLRYYKPITCSNCKRGNHLTKNCPQPKEKVCCLCSEPGHGQWQCPQSLCYNCDNPGHDARDCQQPRRNPYTVCFRCRMRGHDQTSCPELWRQYHVTTTPGKIRRWKIKRRKQKYCYNCAGDDHYGHECEEDRMSRYVCVNSPFISRYEKGKSCDMKEEQLSNCGPNQALSCIPATTIDLTESDPCKPVKVAKHSLSTSRKYTPVDEPTEKPASNRSSLVQPTKPKVSKGTPTSQNGFRLPKKELSKFLPPNFVNDKFTGRSNFDNLQKHWSQQKLAKNNECIDLTVTLPRKLKKSKDGAKKSKESGKCCASNINKEDTNNNIADVERNGPGTKQAATSSQSKSLLGKEDEGFKKRKGNESKNEEMLPRNISGGKRKKSRKRKSDAIARDINMEEADLFSWRKVKQVKGQLGDMGEGGADEEEEDMQHQAFNNQWWEKKSGRTKGKGKKWKRKR